METVKDLLENKHHETVTVAEDISVLDALKLMAEKNIGALPVVRGGRLIGIFSERDFARNVTVKGRSTSGTTVGELMIQDVISVSPTDTLEMCIALMMDRKIRHLPVLDIDKLTGVVTLRDVVEHAFPQLQRRIEELENLLAGRD